jgi:hypothetical protein
MYEGRVVRRRAADDAGFLDVGDVACADNGEVPFCGRVENRGCSS